MELSLATGTLSERWRIAVFMSTPQPFQVPIYRVLEERYGISADLFYVKDDTSRGWQSLGHLHPYRLFRQINLWLFTVKLPPLALLAGMLRKRYDAIIIGGWESVYHLFFHVISRIFGIPVIVGSDERNGPGGRGESVRPRLKAWFRSRVLRWILGHAKGGLAPGQMASDYSVLMGFKGLISTGFFGVDCRAFDGDRREYQPGVLNLLYVGRLTWKKRTEDIIQALAILRRDGIPAQLVVAGDGPYFHRIRKRIAKYNLNDCVTMKGTVEHSALPALMREADCLVLPTQGEAWGVVVAEAASSGLTLVLSDHVGAIPDLVRVGENGYVFPAADVAALAQCLKQLWTDKQSGRLPAMGQLSRSMGQGFSFERCAEAYWKVIQNAVGADLNGGEVPT